MRCIRPLRVPLLAARHCTARLQWARAHQGWLLPQWRNVPFSDKSRFGLVSDDYRERAWRERGGQNRLATAIGINLSKSEKKKEMILMRHSHSNTNIIESDMDKENQEEDRKSQTLSTRAYEKATPLVIVTIEEHMMNL
nr:unnamed protein product [Callosobruchus chinensis]